MLYYTAMIILHRPPRQSFRNLNISTSKDVEICYKSLDSNMRLLRIYCRQHNFRHLPFTFVHILASTASVVLMKRHISKLSWDDVRISRPLSLILEALDAISQTWSCATQVQEVITSAMAAPSPEEDRSVSPQSFDFIARLEDAASFEPMGFDMGFDMTSDDMGLFDPSSFLSDVFQ